MGMDVNLFWVKRQENIKFNEMVNNFAKRAIFEGSVYEDYRLIQTFGICRNTFFEFRDRICATILRINILRSLHWKLFSFSTRTKIFHDTINF